MLTSSGKSSATASIGSSDALLETRIDNNVDRVELLPATPVAILEGEQAYRLVAVTDVELFTIYAPR